MYTGLKFRLEINKSSPPPTKVLLFKCEEENGVNELAGVEVPFGSEYSGRDIVTNIILYSFWMILLCTN